MPAIPVVPGSQMVRTPDAGLKLDAGALNAPNQARMNMGAAIGQAGQQLGDFAQKLQATVNYGIAADADREMQMATADFQKGLAGRTDEDQWETEWKDRAQEVQQNVLDKHRVGPALKRQLDQNFKGWAQANQIEVRTIANKQKINRAVNQAVGQLDEQAKSGEAGLGPDGKPQSLETAMQRTLAPLVELGALTPEAAANKVKGALEKSDDFAARLLIDNNPGRAYDMLELKDKDGKPALFEHLNSRQRQVLVNVARTQRSAYHGANLQAMVANIEAGGAVMDEQLDELVKAGEIGTEEKRAYKQAVKTAAGKVTPEEARAANSVIELKVPEVAAIMDPQQRERAKNRLMLTDEFRALPANVQSNWEKQMDNPDHPMNKPEAVTELQDIKFQFGKGTYGKYEVVVPTVAGDPGYPQQEFKTITDQKKLAQAIANRTEVEQFTRNLFRNNPGISAVEANKQIAVFQEKFTGQVIRRAVEAAVGADKGAGAPVDPVIDPVAAWLKANPNDPRAAEIRAFSRTQFRPVWPDDR